MKSSSELDKISRKLIKMLRHDPLPLKIDGKGRFLITEVLEHFDIELDELNHIVDTNNKKRFSLDETYVWANQGHSIDVDVPLEVIDDPTLVLYHGTSVDAYEKICKTMLSKCSRQHVHWTADLALATKRASQRTGNKNDMKLIVLDVRKFRADGHKIYKSANDVYLTDDVDPKYLK